MVLALGGTVVRAPVPVHGWTTEVTHDGTGVFAGLPSPFRATRYHSLCAGVVPAEVRVNAWSEGVVMGIEVPARRWSGVQFHPESVRTLHGRELVGTLLRREAR
jgi:anthranilate synthase component 2